jgi:hypothetical protein
MSKQVGGGDNLGFTKQDHKNYLRNKRQRALKFGEAASLGKLQVWKGISVINLNKILHIIMLFN